MTRRWSFPVLLTVLLALVVCRPVSAQFETPNRAFHNATGFPLEGRHTDVACASCHLNGQMKGTPTACYQCHWVRRKDDRFQTRLGAQCEQCHRPTAWNAVRWDHAAMTGEPLGAAHRQLSCETCHKANTFKAATAACVSCHAKDYDATRSPAHAAAGFPRTCDSCHLPSDVSFRNQNGAGFNHAAFFPLVGLHATVNCQTCHKNNVYRGTPRDCVGCHQADYNQTKNPNHVAAGFPTTCDACHRATDPQWNAAAPFNHNSVFALVGVHASVACLTCHKNNVYAGTPRDCVGCHQTDYNQTKNPSHAASGFSTACETCHRPTDAQWSGGGTFNHNAVFALVGVHATVACQVCHKNNVYAGTPRDCVGCHQADYNQTRNPNHAASGFSTACETCHRPTDAQWSGGGTFNHNAVFALVGVHATVACATCHKNNVFKGTPRDCVGCHLADYNQTKSPNHAASGFPTTCDACHRATDAQWTGASFNHNSFFALVGVHATVACATCHKNNVYKGTPQDCVGCHLADYNQTKNPNHAASGFPTTCEACHRATDSNWLQGTFAHTAFPLKGPHNVPCAQCHTTPNNFTVFNCLTCHSRGQTDSNHRSVRGYVYDSVACYSCHPTGKGG